jgi:hypothetical protein
MLSLMMEGAVLIEEVGDTRGEALDTLDALGEALELTDYAIGEALGMCSGAVSLWRSKGRIPGRGSSAAQLVRWLATLYGLDTHPIEETT